MTCHLQNKFYTERHSVGVEDPRCSVTCITKVVSVTGGCIDFTAVDIHTVEHASETTTATATGKQQQQQQQQQQQAVCPKSALFASPVYECTLAGSPRLHVSLEPRSGGNCDDCELLFGMSSSRSRWSWRQHFTTQPTARPGPSTTPHGDRRTQAPSTTNFLTRTWCLRGIPGHPVWVSRGGHRTRISSAPWSRLPITPLWYKFWILLWRTW